MRLASSALVLVRRPALKHDKAHVTLLCTETKTLRHAGRCSAAAWVDRARHAQAALHIENTAAADYSLAFEMRSRVLSNNVAQLGMTCCLVRQHLRFPVRSHAVVRLAALASSALTCGMSPQCNPLGRSPSTEHLCTLPHAAGPASLGGKPRRSPPEGAAHRGVQRLAATRGQLPPGWHDVTGCLPPLRVPGDLWGAVNVSWTAISGVLSPCKSAEPHHTSRGFSTRVRCARAACSGTMGRISLHCPCGMAPDYAPT